MNRKNRRKQLNWPRVSRRLLSRNVLRWLRWLLVALVTLLLYALLKTVATGQGFFGAWLATFLNTIEGVFIYLSHTILSPVGLIVLALIWLIKTGDFYQLLNKLRYMSLAKGDHPVVRHMPSGAEKKDTEDVPLNAWQRSLLGEIERTNNIPLQKLKLSQLVVYEQLAESDVFLPLLQFLHHYRRDDITFHQIAQFLIGEGLLEKERLSGPELDVESTVLGYVSYLQHAGIIEAHVTLQPGPDGFYGMIHKVKIPQHVQEVMVVFSEP